MQTNGQTRGLTQSVDWKLIIAYLLLVIIGWANIYASVHSADPSSIFDWDVRSGKQFVWIMTSLGLAALILFVIRPSAWESLSVPIYAGVLILLVAVIFLGVEAKGSRSWFAFGPVRFQPAEISKISTSLLLATVMSQPNFRITKFKYFAVAALIIAVPMMAILAESETGSAIVYIGFIFVLYREGLSGWFIAVIGMVALLFITTLAISPYWSVVILISILAICCMVERGGPDKRFLFNLIFIAVAAFLPKLWALMADADASRFSELADGVKTFLLKAKPIHIILGACLLSLPFFFYLAYKEKNRFAMMAAGFFIAGSAVIFSSDFLLNDILQEHQRKRVEVLLGIKEDPAGVGYNVNQSMIAIGSGGLKGKGFLNGTQTTYGFVPEQSTDFIFCTVGEEWGFIGCAIVILLYVFIICRIIIDAEQCRTAFTRIYGYCAASCIFMHLFINIGMTIGLMPVIGIPLPLLSYGGSSLWAFTIMIFIFIALCREERKYFA